MRPLRASIPVPERPGAFFEYIPLHESRLEAPPSRPSLQAVLNQI